MKILPDELVRTVHKLVILFCILFTLLITGCHFDLKKYQMGMDLFSYNLHPYIHESNLVSFQISDLELLLHLDHVGDGLEEHLDRADVHLRVDILLEGVVVLGHVPVLLLLLVVVVHLLH